MRKYFQIFATGSHSNADLIAEYLNRYFSLTVGYGSAVGRLVIEDRWRSLSWCFELVSFRQVSQKPVVYQPQQNQYLIQAKAQYTLQITTRTLELVFPHVTPEWEELMGSLLGSTMTVDAELSFSLERGTGLIAAVNEQMDFKTALSAIVETPDELAFVLSSADQILSSYVGEVHTDPRDVTSRKQDGESTSSHVSSGHAAQSDRSGSEANSSVSNILG